MKTLLISLSGIGNTVMALPLLEELRSQSDRLDLLVAPRGTQQLLCGNEHVDNLYVIEHPTPLGLCRESRLLHTLRNNRYDAAYCVYPSQGMFSALLMRLIGADERRQHRYDFNLLSDIDWFLTRAPAIRDKHAVHLNLDLLDRAVADVRYEYSLPGKARSAAKRVWQEHGLDGSFVLGIHPGGKKDMEWKRWGADKWKELVSLLRETIPDLECLVFLGPDEEEYRARFSEETVVEEPLLTAIALIQRCDYFISNDSGLSHCASLVQTPQTAIFGGTSPTHTKPFSPVAQVVTPQPYEVFYEPYYGFTSEPEDLLGSLAPTTVLEEVTAHLSALENKGGSSKNRS